MSTAKETPTASPAFNPWRAVRDASDETPARGDASAVVARDADAPASIDEAKAREEPRPAGPAPRAPLPVEEPSREATSPGASSPEAASTAPPPPVETAPIAAREASTPATRPSATAVQEETPPPATIAPVAIATAAASGAPATRSFLGAMPDKGLFLLFAFGGFALVVAMKSRGAEPLHAAGAAVAVT